MVAASTTLPVIGVPIALKHLEGLDSLLSIVQMPKGIPVATVGIGQAGNAGLLALRILALQDETIASWVENFMHQQTTEVLAKKLGS
jgi:5-(carboxyamino)imidazole ribonucleotide mutase